MTTTMQVETTQGLRLHQAGDFAGAARHYEAALARDPHDADAACLMGMVHQAEGRPGAALGYIERAIAGRPEVPAFQECLGLALLALGRPAEAASAFARMLELDPGSAAAHANLGVARRSLGDRDAALEHFRRAVAIAPRLAPARTNLGELLLELGRPDEALTHCQEAAALDPGLMEGHLNLGNVLLALGRAAEATASYYEAHRLDPARARTAAALGLAAVRRGDLVEAVGWFRRAVDREPDSVEFLRYLAEAAGTIGMHAEVRSACERILALDPDQGVAHNALAWVLQREGRYDEARAHYEAAIRLQPDFVTSHFNLGVLCEDLGELDGAASCYRRVLGHDPTHAIALARLAGVERGALPEDDLRAVRERLEDRDLPRRDRANLRFALALVRDERGEYAEAAACLREANALALDELTEQGRRYVPASHRRFVDGIIAAFGAERIARLAAAGLETDRPVFIIGQPRSGTTLIEQVLASHPEVFGAGEVAFARRGLDSLPELTGRGGDPLDAVPSLGPAILRDLAARHERGLADLDGGRARRIISKMPEDYFYLGLIAMMFPRALVIHCRRDLRDVALSCWMNNFTEVTWANHTEHIATRIEDYLRLMDHWRLALPPSFRVLEIAYEDAVADLEGAARRLLAALGLDWHPACLEFHRTRRPVRTASQVQVRRPLYRGSVGRWRLYREELADLFARLERAGS